VKLKAHDYLFLDLIITILFSVFWLWFSWQHGFGNSPDSWYRGLLGKSFIEGHPYFINIKQGWLFESSPWHHDISYSPLLPVLYAVFFLCFGYRIVIANLIVSFSAGLLVFPLLRLSRRMFGSPLAGLLIYLLNAFNDKTGFLFEVFSGLSIPTTVMFLAFFFFCLWRMLESDRKSFLWGAVVSLAAFYYIRPGEQVVFVVLLLGSIALGRRLLEAAQFKRLLQMWGGAGLLACPWFLRNLILFRSPFFSGNTLQIWTDRGYDYYSYHEKIPFPTPTAYFRTHSLLDFINKILVRGSGNFLATFSQALYGPLSAYLIVWALSLAILFIKLKDRPRRFFFSVVILVVLGYSLVYCVMPVLEQRYMMPPFFLLTFVVVTALFYALSGLPERPKRALIAVVFLLALALHRDFWREDFPKQFTFSYVGADQIARTDPMIEQFKQKIGQQEVVLGPFTEVQRLNFATGLTLIEEPDNLRQLDDPAAFFRKYNIRYSLVDISGLLPASMIESVEVVGERLLFKIRLSSREAAVEQRRERPLSVSASLAEGLRQRVVFVDAYHGGELERPAVLRDFGAKLFTSTAGLLADRDRLFRSGVLLIDYKVGGRELAPGELELVRQFIAGGGRVFLLCPAWVWYSYDRKGIERSPYYQIGREFGLTLTGQQIAMTGKFEGVFSKIIFDHGEVLLKGPAQEALAVYSEKGGSRIIVWGQNNILSGSFLAAPANRKFLGNLFGRLWEK
jgi:hypothetical protein